MTLARKGSRTITVDGTAYRWKVRHRPTYGQGIGQTPLSYVAEHDGQPGALLVVTVPWAHPSNWMGQESAPIRPVMVAAAIRKAKTLGWRPDHPGPAFTLADPPAAASSAPGSLTSEVVTVLPVS